MSASDRVPAQFALEVITDGESAIVCPCGDVDLATAGEVEARAIELLEQGERWVCIDLRGVTFLDSSGIRAIIAAHQRAERLGARLQLVRGSRAAMRVLELTGLLDYLHVADSGLDGAGMP